MQKHNPAILPEHDEDFFAWTQHQAELLRACRSSASKLPTGIDLEHLAEEIEDLGKAELRGAKSLIRQIFVHLIKAASQPNSEALGHWRSEAMEFGFQLPDYYAPSMRRLIDVQDLWSKALKGAATNLREHDASLAPGLPKVCPFTVEEAVAEDFDFDKALARLTDGLGSAGDLRRRPGRPKQPK